MTAKTTEKSSEHVELEKLVHDRDRFYNLRGEEVEVEQIGDGVFLRGKLIDRWPNPSGLWGSYIKEFSCDLIDMKPDRANAYWEVFSLSGNESDVHRINYYRIVDVHKDKLHWNVR